MPARLAISETAYSLLEARDEQWVELACLPAGADALLVPARAIDEGALEAAIELAEDWLMPHAARLRGEVLHVDDATGRLEAGLEEVLSVTGSEWTVDEIEGFFLRLVDMSTGRHPSPALQARQRFVADVVMLRELAHHGRLRAIRLA
jgi:hypothetical protein